MKVKFFTRPSTKKIKPQEVPIYVRLRDDVIDLWQKTGILVAPDQWDPKREDLKERIVILKEDRAKFSDNLHELRKYIRECYDKDVAKNIIGKQWLLTVLTNFNKQKNAPPPKEKSVIFEKLFTRFLKEHRLADTRKRQMLVVMRAVMRFELYKQKSGNKSFRFNVKTLTNAIMKEFWNFLKNEHKISKDYPEIYKEVKDCQSVISQRSNNTLVGFIKRLKVFFSWCIEEGLHAIYNCDLSDAPHLDRQRDIFVFQCWSLSIRQPWQSLKSIRIMKVLSFSHSSPSPNTMTR